MPNRVLVIEDDADIAEMLAWALSDEGYDVEVCVNSGQAVEMVQSLMPDVILMDLMMPPPDGFALVPLIRGHEPTSRIPIILISAIDQIERHREALGLRFALPKPLDLWQLFEAIRRVTAVAI